MHGAILFLAGLFVGGAVGVAAMCLVQVTRCSQCPQRAKNFRQDGR